MNEFDRWFRDGGDSQFRYNYNLNENSLVLDVGGYEGNFASTIFEKYKCNVWVFEPLRGYFENLEKKFEHNPKIKLFNFGLSNKNKKLKIFESDDATSLFIESENFEEIEVKSINDFILENKLEKIDLLKLNIEGAEFDVLNDLIANKKLRIINNLQVQFHSFIENAIEKRNIIRNELIKEHNETFCYEFVWENWELDKDKVIY